MKPRGSSPSLETIRRMLSPILSEQAVKKAIVFGSYARGDADEYSDLDLIVVGETDKDFFHRHENFRDLYDVWGRGFDLLCYTPSEFSRMIEDGNPFIEHALKEGVVIYEE